MKNVSAIASYTLKLFSAPKHKTFRLCLVDAVKYYNSGQYDHELCCAAAKQIASWRKTRQTDNRQLSLF